MIEMKAPKSKFRQLVRDYGLKSATGILIADFRHHAVRRLVRAAMFVTQTELGLAEMWDDYLHDNMPDSWDDVNDDEATLERAQELLWLFVQHDLPKNMLEDLFMLRR